MMSESPPAERVPMRRALFLNCFFLFPLNIHAEPPKPALAGYWEGTLKITAVELRLGFEFTKEAGGAFKGKMDSIDQGAKDLDLDVVTFIDNKVTLNYKKGGITYTGRLASDGSSITGTFRQGGLELPL